MLDPATIDLDVIATALADQDDYDHRWLVHAKTGEIVYWTADSGINGQDPIDLDDLDPELIAIDALPSRVWYRDVADFAERLSDERATRRLTRALTGRGAFRRFRDELYEEYPELVKVWNAFREGRAKRRAVEWLVEMELVTDADVARCLEEHPEPRLP